MGLLWSEVAFDDVGDAVFHEILEILTGTEPRFTAVLDAQNASAYLSKMPLFAGLWTDDPRSFCRIIVSLVQKPMVNELVRRVEAITGPLRGSDQVLITIQDVFFSGGSMAR